MEMQENDLILPVLYVINKRGRTVEKEICDAIGIVFQPEKVENRSLDKANRLAFQVLLKELLNTRFSEILECFVDRCMIGRKKMFKLNSAGLGKLRKHVDEVDYLFRLECDREHRIRLAKIMASLNNKKRSLYIYDEDSMRYSVTTPIGKDFVYRRGQQIREEMIRRTRERQGKVCCSMCGLDFEKQYGVHGIRLLELHHTEPLFQFSDDAFGEYMDTADKLVRLVCPNCHRLLHVGGISEQDA